MNMRVPRRLARVGAAADLPDATAFDAYVGPSGEITVDHLRGIIALHDGSTPGGIHFKVADSGGSAASVTYENTVSGLAATTVQAALDELASGAGVPLPLPTLSNSPGDLINDIDFSAGEALDSTKSIIIPCAAMTKRLDANWAPGSGAGGRYSGSAIANTTYHCWVIAKAGGSGQDYYFDPSANPATVLAHVQAEPGGAAYAYVRRPGSIVRESGAIVLFKQDGDLFVRVPTTLNSVNPGTAAQAVSLAVPSGIRLCVDVGLGISISASGALEFCMLATDLSQPDTPPSNDNASLILQTQASGLYRIVGSASVMTNLVGQVRIRLSNSNSDFVQKITTRQWIDRRAV